jgi:hypothetical protein
MNVGLCDFERHPFDLLMYNKEQPRGAASTSTSSGAT